MRVFLPCRQNRDHDNYLGLPDRLRPFAEYSLNHCVQIPCRNIRCGVINEHRASETTYLAFIGRS